MWRRFTDFLSTWQGKAVVAGAVVVGVTGLLLLRKKPAPKTTTQDRDPKYVQIDILSKEQLLRFFRLLREKYTKEYVAVRAEARRKRRQLPPDSSEYRECVLALTEKSKEILEAKTLEVLDILRVKEETIDHSMFYYVKDSEIEEAKNVVNEPLNDAKLPNDMTLEKARDVMSYFQENLVAQDEDSLDEYLVTTAQVEDQVFHQFGIESEVMEKAFEKYGAELRDLSEPMMHQTRFVLQQTSEDSFESEPSP